MTLDYEFSDGSFRRIGKFVDIRRISRMDGGDASGGFGTTYIASSLELGGRLVVLKEFFPGEIAARDRLGRVGPAPSAEQQFYDLRQKFISEADTLARCDFPGVVTIHDRLDFGNGANTFMVLEFVRDRVSADTIAFADQLYHKSAGMADRAAPTLEEVVLFQKPDFVTFAKTFYRLLDTMENVHSEGIFHRDIKPSNVMMPLRRVDEDHEVRLERRPILIDFGASRQTTSGPKRSISLIYTVGYAPPEQINLHGEEGACTDIFALAATAYFALTGRHPDAAMLGEGTGGANYFWAATGGACSQEFAAAMEWALKRDPRDRPQSVREWRRRLPQFEVKEQRRWSRRQMILAAAGAGGVAAAAGLGIVAWTPGLPDTVTTTVRKPMLSSISPVGIAGNRMSGRIALTPAGAALVTNENTADAYCLFAALLGDKNAARATYRSTQYLSFGSDILPLSDGGLIAGGFAGASPFKALLIRIGSDGRELWSRSPDIGAVKSLALANNRIYAACGSADPLDKTGVAKLHIFNLDGQELGSPFDVSVRGYESLVRIAVLDGERIITLCQRVLRDGMIGGVLSGYQLGSKGVSDLWPSYSDEKWLDEGGFKYSQPTDLVVVNGEAFVSGMVASGEDEGVRYSPYLQRFDCEHGVRRWATASPFGPEASTTPIATVALALVDEGSDRRLYAGYCLPDAKGENLQSRIVQISPDGQALSLATIGGPGQPFNLQSLAANAAGAVAMGYTRFPDYKLLVAKLGWEV